MDDATYHVPVERRHQVNGIGICTFETGSGAPMILAHGITANGRVWDPIAAHFATRGWQVTALDQRGHGRTGPAADAAYASADFAADLAGLVDTLGKGPAVLVGHSLGGRNALAAAALFPGSVRAVVSIEYTPVSGALDFSVVADRLRLAALPLPDAAAVDANLRVRLPLLPADAILRRRQFGYTQRPDGSLVPLAETGALQATLQGLVEDVGWHLEDVRLPALMIMGTLDGSVTTAAERETESLRPDIPVIRIDGTDHFVHEEKPAEVCTVIEQWLVRSLRV